MTLTDPTWIEKQSPRTKAIAFCAVLLVIIGGILFTVHTVRNYRARKQIEQGIANVNAAMKQVANAQMVVGGDKVAENRAVEDFKESANTVIEASTATDEAKAEANAAVANFIATKNANRPTGTTEEDLKRKLEALGQ